jgi:hypothetical protein
VLGLTVVLVVVVVVFGCGLVRDTPMLAASGVLREFVGGWGCALTCGAGVVRVVVVHVVWYIGVVVGVLANVFCGCVGAGGCVYVCCVVAMVVCCCILGFGMFVVVVVS